MNHRATEPQRRLEDTDNRRERKVKRHNWLLSAYSGYSAVAICCCSLFRFRCFASLRLCVFAFHQWLVPQLTQSRKAAKPQSGKP